MITVGVVSPGAMGSALGRALVTGGARVVATVEGRSARTARLAERIELLPGLDDVAAASTSGPAADERQRSWLRATSVFSPALPGQAEPDAAG